MMGDIHEEAAPPPAVIDHSALSHCCGAAALAHIVEGWGVCSDCKQHAYFSDEEDS